MSDYDFSTLNDKEFEVFCADIVGIAEGARFERFKRGRDGGVDGRYFKRDGQEVILQCKHWANTPVEHLIRYLKKDELPKLKRLRPVRYLLALSHTLSRTDKTAIHAALNPFVKSRSDIFGREDLNDLLAKNPDVEQRHYKLWLCSASVLTHLMDKPILERSAFLIEEAIESAKKYVPTTNHDLAIARLEEIRTVIISGEAGVGKTTLAKQLCLHYVRDGFQLLQIEEDLREAESVFGQHRKQIFYFDDFLGRNYLEALSGHEGNRIVQFIRRVARDPNKRFILTSRSTILNQGKVLMDSFENENLHQNEFEISVTSLTELDRARILYNHIWHSGLAPEYVDELYREKRYRTVIDHDNYNPRLISFITDVGRLTDCPPNGYWQYIRQSLDNPADIWENPFVAQQDDFGRATVFVVTLNGRAVAHDELAEAYSRFVSLSQNSSMSGHKDFLTNLRHLTGSLLSRTFLTSDVSRAYVNLFSPAIGDFVLRRYAKDIPSMKSGFLSLRSVSSVDTLGSLHKNKYIGASAYREILRALLVQANGQEFSGYSPQYIASIAARIIETKSSLPLNLLYPCVDFVIQEEVPGTFLEVAGIISWGQTSERVSDEQAAQFVVRACANSPNSEEIKMLVDIASDIEQASKGYLLAIDTIKVAAMEYLMENMDEEVDDDEVFNGVEYHDLGDARRNLGLSIGRALDKLGVECSDREVEEIGDAYELDDKRDEYFKNEPDYPVPRSHASVVIESDEIDELFDRTSMPRPS